MARIGYSATVEPIVTNPPIVAALPANIENFTVAFYGPTLADDVEMQPPAIRALIAARTLDPVATITDRNNLIATGTLRTGDVVPITNRGDGNPGDSRYTGVPARPWENLWENGGGTRLPDVNTLGDLPATGNIGDIQPVLDAGGGTFAEYRWNGARWVRPPIRFNAVATTTLRDALVPVVGDVVSTTTPAANWVYVGAPENWSQLGAGSAPTLFTPTNITNLNLITTAVNGDFAVVLDIGNGQTATYERVNGAWSRSPMRLTNVANLAAVPAVAALTPPALAVGDTLPVDDIDGSGNPGVMLWDGAAFQQLGGATSPTTWTPVTANGALLVPGKYVLMPGVTAITLNVAAAALGQSVELRNLTGTLVNVATSAGQINGARPNIATTAAPNVSIVGSALLPLVANAATELYWDSANLNQLEPINGGFHSEVITPGVPNPNPIYYAGLEVIDTGSETDGHWFTTYDVDGNPDWRQEKASGSGGGAGGFDIDGLPVVTTAPATALAAISIGGTESAIAVSNLFARLFVPISADNEVLGLNGLYYFDGNVNIAMLETNAAKASQFIRITNNGLVPTTITPQTGAFLDYYDPSSATIASFDLPPNATAELVFDGTNYRFTRPIENGLSDTLPEERLSVSHRLRGSLVPAFPDGYYVTTRNAGNAMVWFQVSP